MDILELGLSLDGGMQHAAAFLSKYKVDSSLVMKV